MPPDLPAMQWVAAAGATVGFAGASAAGRRARLSVRCRWCLAMWYQWTSRGAGPASVKAGG
eukprot:2988186-Rhodomonas_salina.1